jgi:hypothetical protein
MLITARVVNGFGDGALLLQTMSIYTAEISLF